MDAEQAVRAYHQLSKHRPDGYAAGPGQLDWATTTNTTTTIKEDRRP